MTTTTMVERTAAGPSRRLIAWVVLSLDGLSAGPGGDMAWLGAHAAHEQVMTYHEGVWRGVSTALMGRTNYEGFYGYWPPVAQDPRSAPRDRALATWLDTVEKGVGLFPPRPPYVAPRRRPPPAGLSQKRGAGGLPPAPAGRAEAQTG